MTLAHEPPDGAPGSVGSYRDRVRGLDDARHAISARVDAARQCINELQAEPQQHLVPDDGPGRDL